MLDAVGGVGACCLYGQYPAAIDPPADVSAPGFRPVEVDGGPNEFRLDVEGPDPQLATGGTHDQQERQRDAMIALAMPALSSYVTGHTPLTPRAPSDAAVRDILGRLDRNPPLGIDGREVTHAVYQSRISNATPQEAYEHVVNHPEEVFGAGGMEIRPQADRLEDGGRYMLEIGGPVPTWLPVEIQLDPANHAFTIHTLDGHVLRGTQTFTFTADGDGGTVLTQDARFQASSKLPAELQQLSSISRGQHEAWLHAHREIYEQFNGDRSYEGIGTAAFNRQQLGAWAEGLRNVIVDPGRSADAMIDAGGEVANAGFDFAGRFADSGIDMTGNIVGWGLDTFGLPGGDYARRAYDVAGDGVEWLADRAGDVTSGAMDIAGDGARVFIDVANPFD